MWLYIHSNFQKSKIWKNESLITVHRTNPHRQGEELCKSYDRDRKNGNKTIQKDKTLSTMLRPMEQLYDNTNVLSYGTIDQKGYYSAQIWPQQGS